MTQDSSRPRRRAGRADADTSATTPLAGNACEERPQGMNDAKPRTARYKLGDVVKHRVYPFRGVVFDIDPTFSNTEEWWQAIPEEVRPVKDQPFYHLLAENAETEYVAYVSEQNLLPDTSHEPLRHPQIDEVFAKLPDGSLKPKAISLN
jgi:heat shock protein HspQ